MMVPTAQHLRTTYRNRISRPHSDGLSGAVVNKSGYDANGRLSFEVALKPVSHGNCCYSIH